MIITGASARALTGRSSARFEQGTWITVVSMLGDARATVQHADGRIIRARFGKAFHIDPIVLAGWMLLPQRSKTARSEAAHPPSLGLTW
jgi:hypothetical protein